MRLRVATFNVENLVSRNRYGARDRPDTAPALSLFDFPQGEARENAERSVAVALEDDKRQMTALAIAETRADILALQEVDNLGVLAPFFANYVHTCSDIRYGHQRLVEGNDRRGIDVAFAARRDLVPDEKAVKVRSHHEATFGELDLLNDDLREFGIGPDDRVFNRNCLEVTLTWPDRDLTVFVCHMKSMDHWRPEGRSFTNKIRAAEARAVRRIVEQKFGAGWRDASWIVAGDFNDFRARILAGGGVEPALPSGIDPLFQDFAVDPVAQLPPLERWTYFHRGRDDREGDAAGQHVQLDYLLLSPALAKTNPSPPIEIIRRGLPYRAPLDPAAPDRSIGYLATRADRYPRVGWDRPKASDHCPVVVEIEVPVRGAVGSRQ
ncbi:MAG TPA: endonuclease/exonuclease/phosphatase family protein [Beijerinckiaceae bacterium]|nr:endonuclease/exonuclease/phosphatase family protein [Beijerinckiaceae bacterium]